MSYDPNSIQPPRGWQPSVDPHQQMIPPPIGSRVNVPPSQINNPPMSWTVSTVQDNNLIPPPIGSAPVNMMGQTIHPPIGSEPTNAMGRAYPPPSGADVHPPTCPAGSYGDYGLNPGARFDERHGVVPPPIGSHPANLLAGCTIQPPIGSAPANLLAGQGITPPIGSAPTNYMGQPVQPPRGADLNPATSGGTGRLGPDPTVSTFNEARFYAENPMIPPPIGSSPANQLSGATIPPATTWVMPPPDHR
jgi:hypothetical protein